MKDHEKDESINSTLASLRGRFGDEFVVVDNWDADLMSAGIATRNSSQLVVYFSTHNRAQGRYYVDLESPAPPGSDLPYVQGQKFENVDFETLVLICSQHLKLMV